MAKIFVNPMIRKRIGEKHQLAFGGFYQRSKLNSTANRFVTDIDNPFYDLNPAVDFSARKYWGVNTRYIWDTRNNQLLPTRGMYWISDWRWFKGVGSEDHNFHQLTTDLRFYFNFGRPERSVLAVRAGAAHNSKGYPFFQANKLGVKTNLRGYRQDRFAGDDMVYQNTDFRMRLMRFRTYFLGGELGVLAFNDFGRVWLEGEKSDKWHHGYGGGLWLAPYKMFVVTASYSHSREDNIFSFQFSYLF
jgi:outer membrane protein assembly factor BamA